jgi:hypothetical protein
VTPPAAAVTASLALGASRPRIGPLFEVGEHAYTEGDTGRQRHPRVVSKTPPA